MSDKKIFISSNNFMYVLNSGTWTDGTFGYGTEESGPSMMDNSIPGTFCPKDMLIKGDVSRYESIIEMCSGELQVI